MRPEEKNDRGAQAVVDFFAGRQRTMWAVALALGFAVAVGGGLAAALLPPRGTGAVDITLNILFGLAAAAGAGVCVVCLATLRLRTSKWVADEKGIAYCCLGRQRIRLSWKEIAETGFVAGVRSQTATVWLYWTSRKRPADGWPEVHGGVFYKSARRCLGTYNRKGAQLILYPVDARDPKNDPLVAFTRAASPRPIKNEALLRRAEINF